MNIGHIHPLPKLFSRDSAAILEATYMVLADKAQFQLGWNTRPIEIDMCETIDWIKQRNHRQ